VIPVPERLKSLKQGGMFAGYPAAGLVIGCLLALLFWAAGLVLPDTLAAVALVAGSLLLTGAIHLDGLADCADAFYGKREKEEALRIFKDPRIGTMGGAAIGISLLARFAAVSSLGAPVLLLALPVLSAFSRTAVLLALRLLPYARQAGGIISTDGAQRSGQAGTLVLAVLVVIGAGVLLPVPTVLAILVLAGFWRLSWKRIGGCTGDVLGASTEIVFLAALAATAHIGSAVGLFYALVPLVFPA